jgi:hypothetical protein
VRLLLVAAACLAIPAAARAETGRLVVIKADGLPHEAVARAVQEKNPRTGKSMLPWIDHVFFQGGTRLSSFYVRGMSLSGPSWSMLDTGQHLQIKGNVEFDRYTQRPYDYLNFLPFWLDSATRRRGDMWGTSVLDDLGIPLLLDAFDFDERYQSFQLYQRGSRWITVREGLQNRVTSRTARQLVDEWYLGIDMRGILAEQLERELIAKLDDPRVRYLDYYTTDFDHDTHHNRDHATHLAALQELDALVGRIWTAISRTPQAAKTTLILVSDHGVNTDERAFSQGYNLVHLLAGPSGGGHHVVTKRRLMTDYSIKGIYPFVPLITTTSDHSPYLKDASDRYPTALVDFDGNERASIHLRHSALNVLQILLSELQTRGLKEPVRRAAIAAILSTIEANRAAWSAASTGLREELRAFRLALDALRAAQPPPPDPRRRKDEKEEKPLSPEEQQARLRDIARIEDSERVEAEYAAYAQSLDRLLGLTGDALALPDVRVEDFVAPKAMGERNSLFDLQHYVVGPAPGGLVLAADGSLDFEKSFQRVDYFTLLDSIRIRNNVQRGVTNTPIDFTGFRLPCESGEHAELRAADTCIWLNGGPDLQALILSRFDRDGRLLLRYMPVAGLSQDRYGAIRFEPAPWREDLPLRLWEDAELEVDGNREAWLGAWHTDLEWLRATHRTTYSNAVVGLHEQFARHEVPSLDLDEPGLADEQRLLRRFRLRQRILAEPDILVLASDHWNFDVRGFNPGGNHGSFFRPSTRSTLMLAGGEGTGIPRGLEVSEPYDSLSFMPTLLALTGQLDGDGQPTPALKARGFHAFPGRKIEELAPAYLRMTETLPVKEVKERIAPPPSP